jgi:hypothetical protein
VEGTLTGFRLNRLVIFSIYESWQSHSFLLGRSLRIRKLKTHFNSPRSFTSKDCIGEFLKAAARSRLSGWKNVMISSIKNIRKRYSLTKKQSSSEICRSPSSTSVAVNFFCQSCGALRNPYSAFYSNRHLPTILNPSRHSQ